MFEEITPSLEGIGHMKPEEVQTLLKDLDMNTKTKESLEELNAAEAEIAKLDDGPLKTSYMESLDAAKASITDLRKMYSLLGQLSGTSKYLESAGKKLNDANEKLNDAVAAANDKEYSRGKTLAQEAGALYDQAEKTLRSEHEKQPELELDKAADVVAKKSEAADKAAEILRYGAAGQTSKFNSAIDDYNDLNSEIQKMDAPEVVTNPAMLTEQLTELYVSFTKNVTVAEQKHAQALAQIE